MGRSCKGKEYDLYFMKIKFGKRKKDDRNTSFIL